MPTTAPLDTSATSNETTTAAASTTDPTGPGTTSIGADSTTGGGLCTIDLPPPLECMKAMQGGRSFATPQTSADWNDGYVALEDEVQGGVAFIVAPDAGPNVQCDPIAQDCPDGEKCNPWANDGGSSWNANSCFPLDPDPVGVGETCTAMGSGLSGVDNCEAGAMCFNVDPATLEGTCVELCGCSLDTPLCETPDTTCAISNGGTLPLCRPVCNPLDPTSCPDNQNCVPIGGLFICAPDGSGAEGAPGDPCGFINGCDPGLFCANPGTVPGCGDRTGCCSSYCSGGDASSCLAGQDCVDWYAAGQAPDECLGNVAACVAN